jgi:hypothetical protein
LRAASKRSARAGSGTWPGVALGRQDEVCHPLNHAFAFFGHAPMQRGAERVQFGADGA